MILYQSNFVFRSKLEAWVEPLQHPKEIKIPLSLYPPSICPLRQNLHVFCDISKDAIEYVLYPQTFSDASKVTFGDASVTLPAVSFDPGGPLPKDTFTKNNLESYGPRRNRRVQYLADQFWKRWRRVKSYPLLLHR